MNIHFEGQLTLKDMLEIARLGLKPHLWTSAVYYLFIAMLASVFLMIVSTGYTNFVIALEFLLLLAVMSYRLWLPYLSANALFKRDSSFQNKIQGTITEEEMTIQTILAASTIRWDYFTRIKRSKDLILLYHANGRMFNFLPRAFFADGDWEAVNRLIERRVQDGKMTDVLQTPTLIFLGRRLGKTGTMVWLGVVGGISMIGLLICVWASILNFIGD